MEEPVSTGAQELLEQARCLTAAERAWLADALLASLDQTDADIDAAWAAEADERVRAFAAGELTAVSVDSVLAKYGLRWPSASSQ